MSFLIPVDKLHETELVVAFYHPQPSHQTHILIVPKRQIGSLLEMGKEDTAVLQAVVSTAQLLARQLNLEAGGFTLLVNGGAYQDVAQVHWHLISNDS